MVKSKLISLLLFCLLINILLRSELFAQQLDPIRYDAGSPLLKEIWVDPVKGNDNNDGSSRAKSFQTISAAWNSIPGKTTTTGYRINLVAGEYIYRDQATNSIVGLYLDEKHGTYNYPIIISSADGNLNAHIVSSFDFRDVSYVYLVGLDFKTIASSDGGGNTVHFASGDHILIKNCRIDGFDGVARKPQEALKVNQVKYIYVEESEISGAFWFALDYVGVQYGHIYNCKIHDASEDALLIKGGSAQIRIENCTIYNADRFGFSAGQGAGFDFMVVPWLHYEAYDLKFINNIIYNTNYAGVAVLGGYNILIAYNTLYKIGIDKRDARTLLSFNLGQRGCDGSENDTCNNHHNLGGWSPGPWSNPPLAYGSEWDCIPNKNVFVYNNIFYNPGADSTGGGHFEIRAPYNASDQSQNFLQSSNISSPALSDDNLQMKGNIIWNGSKNKFFGIDENSGGQNSNPTCNISQLSNENSFNSIEPQFINSALLNFHPINNSNIFNSVTYAVPNFAGNDKPDRPLIPSGNLINSISRDYDGKVRQSKNPPGAFVSSTSTSVNNNVHFIPSTFLLEQNYPNPFNPETLISYQISKSGYVTLKIYNVLGKEVATLVDEFKQPGFYNCQLSTGSFQLSSGVYFYKIQAGGFSQTKKMIFLK